MIPRSESISLPRLSAEVTPQGRRCAECGDFIDPIDWCPGCQRADGPCGSPHKRTRKRADAAYCDAACRSRSRSGAISAARWSAGIRKR